MGQTLYSPYEAPLDHLHATEAVCGRLFFWRRGCWYGGPYEAVGEQEFKRCHRAGDLQCWRS